MRPIRNILFWTHLSVGLVGGIVIFIMCVTGVLLSFEDWMTAKCDGHRSGPFPAGASFASINKILTNAPAQELGTPTGLLIRADLSLPVTLSFGREKALLFNAVSGENVGEGCSTIRSFFRAMNEWHRWLGCPESNRAAGRAITGACNLGFLFLVVSGLFLWLPRKWSANNLKYALLLNAKLRGRARDWNWHNAIGFWSAVPLLIIVSTGAIMSYPWANRLLFRAAGSEPPPARKPESRSEANSENRSFPKLDGFDRAFRKVQADFPEWKTIRTRFAASGTVTFAVDSSSGHPQERIQITAKLDTGEIVRQERPSDFERGRRWRLLARFLHTGEAVGIAGRIIATAASAGGGFLVFTGFALAIRRFWRRRSSQNAAEMPVSLSDQVQ